ncbi:MAG: hypothetical protein E4H03_05335 [Myxococcales bacterium]|nr:MAG: hypothetical protein E4H03_05335 [Myxococcales bacterium]
MITNRRTCRAARAFIGVAALSLITASAAPNAWAQAQEAASSTGCGPGGAFEALASFGPFNEFNYPAYYVDQNGLALDLCDETIADDPLCGNPLFGDPLGGGLPFDAPPDIASGNFWAETFYFLATTDIAFAGGDALIVLAVEGVWDNATEAIIDGDQLVFSRIRHRISLPNLPSSAGTYTVTHPFGVDVFEVTEADLALTGGSRVINFTDDCLHGVVNGAITPTCSVTLGDQFTNIIDPTRSRISHYLTWDVNAPPGYIGNPAIPHAVTGSPCGTNVFRVEGPGIPGGVAETTLFSLQGRHSAVCGDGAIDAAAGETCDDGNTVGGDCCSTTCMIEGTDAATCDDGSACTVDTCDSVTGCANTPVSCDDGVGCTVDGCDATVGCTNAPDDGAGNDGTSCTFDTCDVIAGCINSPTFCNDGNACTADSCDAVAGCSSVLISCNDGNACTIDSCSVATGCSNFPIPCAPGSVCNAGTGVCETADLVCIAAGSNGSAVYSGSMTSGPEFAGGLDADAARDSLMPTMAFASDGTSAFQPGSGDQVAYSVAFPAGPGWYAWARSYYPGGPLNDANSFYLRIDGTAAQKLGNNKGFWKTFHWDGDGNVENGPTAGLFVGSLAPGFHSVVVEKREVKPIAPRLDVFCFNHNPTVAPTDAQACEAIGGVCGAGAGSGPPPTTTTTAGGGPTTTVTSTTMAPVGDMVCFAANSGAMTGAMTTSLTYTGGADADPLKDSLSAPVLFPDTNASAFQGGSNDTATYAFSLPDAGPWRMWGRFYYPGAPTNSANSFMVRVDGGSRARFGNNQGYFRKWHWDGDGAETGPVTGMAISAGAGHHTLVVEKREVNPIAPRLDVICFTKDAVTPPSDAAARSAAGLP